MKEKLFFLLAVPCLLLFSGKAFAEGGCPAGMIPAQGTSISTCAPIPSAPGEAAPPAPRWKSRWGAIAADEELGVMGAVADRESKRAASRGALAECTARGGAACKIKLAYYDQCVATVQGGTGANNAHAESLGLAIRTGMESCRKRGDDDCHVYYQACSLPVRIR